MKRNGPAAGLGRPLRARLKLGLGLAAVYAAGAGACHHAITAPVAAVATDPSARASAELVAPLTPAPIAQPAAPAVKAATPEEIRAASDYAQRRILRPADALVPDLPAAGAAQPGDLPGTRVTLEHPEGQAPLAHFYAALEHLSLKTTHRVRVAIYGASGTAQDMWTAYIRAYLQKRFGDGGPGVVAAAPDNRWYHHNELDVSGTSGWVAANPQRKPLEDSNAYGLGLVVMRGIPTLDSKKRAGPVMSTLAPAAARSADLRIAHYEVWSRAHPEGGSFSISIDGALQSTVQTNAETPAALYSAVDLLPGPHTLSIALAGDAEVQLFGVVAESDAPGIVLDNLGFVGARSGAHVQNDEPLWHEQMQRRSYDLVVLAYGTNEGFHDRTQPIDAQVFEQEWSALLERFERAAPEASCVVMLPGLHDAVPAGALSPASRIAAIRPIMSKHAFAHGCAVFDGATLEGAADGMRAWVQAGLARQDYVHLTPRGHARMGMAVADALMQAWDNARAQPQSPALPH